MMDTDDALGTTNNVAKPTSGAGLKPLHFSWLWVFIPLLILLIQPVQWSWSSWFSSGSPLFFQPWIPLGAAYLAWAHRADWERTLTELHELFPDTNSPKRVGNLALILLGGVGLCIAYLAAMPPLALFSLWLLVVGSIYYLHGPFLLRVVLRPLLFLLLVIPPPTGALGQLVSGFQVMSAVGVGQALQALGIAVRISWKAITLLSTGTQIDITPSYTGLGVLFFMLAAALFLLLLRRPALGSAIAFFFLAAASAVVMNCVRLVSLALVAQNAPLLAATFYKIPALPTLLCALALLLLLGRRFLKPRVREELVI